MSLIILVPPHQNSIKVPNKGNAPAIQLDIGRNIPLIYMSTLIDTPHEPRRPLTLLIILSDESIGSPILFLRNLIVLTDGFVGKIDEIILN